MYFFFSFSREVKLEEKVCFVITITELCLPVVIQKLLLKDYAYLYLCSSQYILQMKFLKEVLLQHS